MRRLQGLFGLLLASCAGIQGGSEGEGSGKCDYELVALDDPDAVPPGFDRSPRELLAVATGGFVGRLANGRSVVLQFEADFSDLRALYSDTGDSECGPHLATSAAARVSLDSEGKTDGAGALEFRWGKPLASARFEASAESSLSAAQPGFAASPVGSPVLGVWLTNFAADGVSSEWKWSAFVACGSGQQCSGGPGAGGQATTGVEVSWGTAKLQSE